MSLLATSPSKSMLNTLVAEKKRRAKLKDKGDAVAGDQRIRIGSSSRLDVSQRDAKNLKRIKKKKENEGNTLCQNCIVRYVDIKHEDNEDKKPGPFFASSSDNAPGTQNMFMSFKLEAKVKK